MTYEEWEQLPPAAARGTWRGLLATTRYGWFAISFYELVQLMLLALGHGRVHHLPVVLALLALGSGGFTAVGTAGFAYAESIRVRITHG